MVWFGGGGGAGSRLVVAMVRLGPAPPPKGARTLCPLLKVTLVWWRVGEVEGGVRVGVGVGVGVGTGRGGAGRVWVEREQVDQLVSSNFVSH